MHNNYPRRYFGTRLKRARASLAVFWGEMYTRVFERSGDTLARQTFLFLSFCTDDVRKATVHCCTFCCHACAVFFFFFLLAFAQLEVTLLSHRFYNNDQ